MGSASQQSAHVVGNRSHVGARTNASAKAHTVGVDGKNFEFLDFDLHRLEANVFLWAGQFVGGNALDFLRGERWWSLRDRASELPYQRIEPFPPECDIYWRARGFTFGIVRIGGEAEPDGAFVCLL